MSGKRSISAWGVPVGQAGLLKGSGATDPSGSGAAVVDWMFSSCCMAVANASLIYWKDTVEETHQGSSFIKSGKLAIEKTSWTVAFPSWVILAHFFPCFLASLILCSLYFWANFCGYWPNSHSSWIHAWLKACNCWRAGWYPKSSSIWVLFSWWGRRADKGTNSETGSERWCSSSELFFRTSWEWGYTFNPTSPSSWGKTTLDSEKGSSLCRCSQSSGNWAEEASPERVLTSRWTKWEVPQGI